MINCSMVVLSKTLSIASSFCYNPVMKTQDKENLIKSWPVYLLFVMLLAVMVLFYSHHTPPHGNVPLRESIRQSLTSNSDIQYSSIDEVINDRKFWQPILPGWQGKPVPPFEISRPNQKPLDLSFYTGRQVIVVIWESTNPVCKLQFAVLQEIAQHTNLRIDIIALTTEKPDNLSGFDESEYPDITFGRLDTLPEPLNLYENIPALYFLDSEGRLKLAAEGILPPNHIIAIISLDK